tara:strand:+ start:10 stop:315 length:306 start_codon:yes stop_codon:yes gene_type:complete
MRKFFLILLIIFFSSKIFADDKMILGLEVFNNKAQCGMCHTLKAAKSSGEIGPNLDQLKPQKDQIIYTVTNGIGVMPAFLDTLTVEEIEAVAHYIFNSANN